MRLGDEGASVRFGQTALCKQLGARGLALGLDLLGIRALERM